MSQYINPKAWTQKAQNLLPDDLLAIIVKLHNQFNPKRLELLEQRNIRQAQYDAGAVPEYIEPNSLPHHGDWRISPIPQDLLTRRVEITGPVSSTKMVINMLNPDANGIRADMAMLDFEDSMKPSWDNVLNGIENVKGIAENNLEFTDEKKGKHYQYNTKDHAKLMVRIRGLHLDESNFTVDGQAISGALLDFVATVYHSAKLQIKQGLTPKFYVPKIEHYLEARYWNELFTEVEKNLNIEVGTIRMTFLIETLPAAFQMEEILYELRNHIVAMNVGRWDKIFSDIKVLRNHPDKIMEDRATIDMSKFWMNNYAKRLIKICHSHGAMAIGGMSAFTPGKDAAQREFQTNKVIADKSNEAKIGHDGCWVSHPYFIKPALEQFKQNNQLDRMLESFNKYPDLIPASKGATTLAGLVTNIRVAIAYQKGWNDDIGCVSWDGMMEDLATLEISRAQTWQWMKHKVSLEDGQTVDKTLIKKTFEQEQKRIEQELAEVLKGDALQQQVDLFSQARNDAQALFTQDEFKDFFSMKSDLVT